MESFRQLQRLLGENTTYLIDTYDTIEGARMAASLGRPLWGVRLDSGNLVELSRAVRRILNDGNLREAKIMATGDLNEYKILELVAAGAPIDAFGVGTALATSADSPTLGAVYKMVELQAGGTRRFTAKLSFEKHTMPAAKQVFRMADHDVIAGAWERPGRGASPLLKPVILNGKLVEPLPDAKQAREHAARSLDLLPKACRSLFPMEEPYRVEYSQELNRLLEDARARV